MTIFAQSAGMVSSVSFENVSQIEALKQLSDLVHVDFSYDSKIFNESKKVNFSISNQSIERVLTKIIGASPVLFKWVGDNLVFYKDNAVRWTVRGVVLDEESKEPLPYANVYVPNLQTGISTNEFGVYSLTVPEGNLRLQISYVGFLAKEIEEEVKGDMKIDIPLKMSGLLQEFTVEVKNDSMGIEDVSVGSHMDLLLSFVQNSPSLAGDADLMRASQYLPGIQGGTDGYGGIFVRGGGNGQNLVLMDGVPVYIPFHLMGLYGVFNQSVVKSARVYKGNYPSRYGGRLSSVFDVRIKEGNLDKMDASVQTSLNLVNIAIDGPLNKSKKTSLVLGGRLAPRLYLFEPFFARTNTTKENPKLYTNFFDANVKLTHRFSDKDKVFISYFVGRDRFLEEEDELLEDSTQYHASTRLTWENQVLSGRWNHEFGPKLYSNLSLTYSLFKNRFTNLIQYDAVDTIESSVYYYDNYSYNYDYGVKWDFDYAPNINHNVRFGVGGNSYFFIPDWSYYENDELDHLDTVTVSSLDQVNKSSTREFEMVYAHVEDTWQLSPKSRLRFGARFVYFEGEFRDFKGVEPRIQLSHDWNTKLSSSIGFSQMGQYLHLISNSAIRLPNDIWLPSSDLAKPEKLSQLDVDFAYDLGNGWKLNNSSFYKNMDNLYAHRDGFSHLQQLNSQSPEHFLEAGSGVVVGNEFQLVRVGEKQSLMMSYTLSASSRLFDSINNGNPFYHDYDSRHQFKFIHFLKFNEKWNMSTSFVYFTPYPARYVLYFDQDDGAQSVPPPTGGKNSERGSAYHRLDWSLGYKSIRPKTQHEFNIGIYNGYNSYNVAYYRIDADDPTEAEAVNSLSILPSFSYKISF